MVTIGEPNIAAFANTLEGFLQLPELSREADICSSRTQLFSDSWAEDARVTSQQRRAIASAALGSFGWFALANTSVRCRSRLYTKNSLNCESQE